jgi:hypothetical protein
MFETVILPLPRSHPAHAQATATATATVLVVYNDGRWAKIKGRISFQKDDDEQPPSYRFLLEGHVVQRSDHPSMINHDAESPLDVPSSTIKLPLLQLQLVGKKFASTSSDSKARSIMVTFPRTHQQEEDFGGGVKSIRITTILTETTDHGKYFLKAMQQEQPSQHARSY